LARRDARGPLVEATRTVLAPAGDVSALIGRKDAILLERKLMRLKAED